MLGDCVSRKTTKRFLENKAVLKKIPFLRKFVYSCYLGLCSSIYILLSENMLQTFLLVLMLCEFWSLRVKNFQLDVDTKLPCLLRNLKLFHSESFLTHPLPASPPTGFAQPYTPQTLNTPSLGMFGMRNFRYRYTEKIIPILSVYRFSFDNYKGKFFNGNFLEILSNSKRENDNFEAVSNMFRTTRTQCKIS